MKRVAARNGTNTVDPYRVNLNIYDEFIINRFKSSPKGKKIIMPSIEMYFNSCESSWIINNSVSTSHMTGTAGELNIHVVFCASTLSLHCGVFFLKFQWMSRSLPHASKPSSPQFEFNTYSLFVSWRKRPENILIISSDSTRAADNP